MELVIKRLMKKYGVSEECIKDIFKYVERYGVNDSTLTLAIKAEYGIDKEVAKDFIQNYKKAIA